MKFLQFVAPNLCGFDPGLKAGSNEATKSNLVISLVPYEEAKKNKNKQQQKAFSVLSYSSAKCFSFFLASQIIGLFAKFSVWFLLIFQLCIQKFRLSVFYFEKVYKKTRKTRRSFAFLSGCSNPK